MRMQIYFCYIFICFFFVVIFLLYNSPRNISKFLNIATIIFSFLGLVININIKKNMFPLKIFLNMSKWTINLKKIKLTIIQNLILLLGLKIIFFFGFKYKNKNYVTNYNKLG